MKIINLSMGIVLAIAAASAHAGPITFSASGTSAASIQGTVDAFRAAVGTLNPNIPGSLGSGRREISWDGVPDLLAAPNNLPGDFFNTTSPRGVELSTPGTGLQVSANTGVPPVEFDNIQNGYSRLFQPFSTQRLFTALGSNIVDVSFLIPGAATPALTSAFGVVFSDIDDANSTSIEFFDALDQTLGAFFAPAIIGNETFSFLGVSFSEGSVIARARITSGSVVLAPGTVAGDLVVMDDFIYGEPVAAAVPEPATTLLLLAGLAAICRRRPAMPTRISKH